MQFPPPSANTAQKTINLAAVLALSTHYGPTQKLLPAIIPFMTIHIKEEFFCSGKLANTYSTARV